MEKYDIHKLTSEVEYVFIVFLHNLHSLGWSNNPACQAEFYFVFLLALCYDGKHYAHLICLPFDVLLLCSIYCPQIYNGSH